MHKKDMSADAVGGIVVDGPDLEVDGLQAAEGALDRAQALVGADGFRGVERTGGQAGADDVQAVQGRFGGDGIGFAAVAERGVGDLDVEVLGHLVAADDLADPQGDLVLARQGPLRALDGGGDGIEQALGRQ